LLNARKNVTTKPNNFSAAEAMPAIRLKAEFFSADIRLRLKIRRRRPNSAALGSTSRVNSRAFSFANRIIDVYETV